MKRVGAQAGGILPADCEAICDLFERLRIPAGERERLLRMAAGRVDSGGLRRMLNSVYGMLGAVVFPYKGKQ